MSWKMLEEYLTTSLSIMSLTHHVLDSCLQHHECFISLLRQLKSPKGPSTLSARCLNIFILRQDEIVGIWVNVKHQCTYDASKVPLVVSFLDSRQEPTLQLSKQNQRELNSKFIWRLKMFKKQIIKASHIFKMFKSSLDYKKRWDSIHFGFIEKLVEILKSNES